MSKSSAQCKVIHRGASVLEQLGKALSNAPLTKALESCVELLRRSSDHYDWVGIYLVNENNLVLEAYAGHAGTEHVVIPVGEGICGVAAKEGTTVLVPDVRKDPRYLMCFPSTRSEIVVPIKGERGVLGEIDIDSDHLSAFGHEDIEVLERAASMLAKSLEKMGFTP